MAQNNEMQTYSEFWPFYLREHRKKRTRQLHFAGTSIALGFIVLAISFGSPVMLVPALLSGYAFAWYAHFAVEKNRPATFKYPIWSFFSDWKMWFLQVTGQLHSELQKYQIGDE